MAESQYYCAECDTHFCGPPNYVEPEEHLEIAHDGDEDVMEKILEGDWKDWERRQQFKYD